MRFSLSNLILKSFDFHHFAFKIGNALFVFRYVFLKINTGSLIFSQYESFTLSCFFFFALMLKMMTSDA